MVEQFQRSTSLSRLLRVVPSLDLRVKLISLSVQDKRPTQSSFFLNFLCVFFFPFCLHHTAWSLDLFYKFEIITTSIWDQTAKIIPSNSPFLQVTSSLLIYNFYKLFLASVLNWYEKFSIPSVVFRTAPMRWLFSLAGYTLGTVITRNL